MIPNWYAMISYKYGNAFDISSALKKDYISASKLE